MNDETTQLGETIDHASGGDGQVLLTVVWHDNAARIGATTALSLDETLPIPVNRLGPRFSDGAAIESRRVSRTPLQLQARGESIGVWAENASLKVRVEDQPLQGTRWLTPSELDNGVLIELGTGVLLMLERRPTETDTPSFGLVGGGRAMHTLRARLHRLGGLDGDVLLTGPSGTGKELVARALHDSSSRAGGPFVAVNLAALAAGTAPSQLFGHAAGSFTGANSASRGFFAQAEGGTLFLDEVGACPFDVQAQLLRALEARQIQPVGGPIRDVDLRIIAATDDDLDAAMRDGRFREALFYRLASLRIELPPLAGRRIDIATQFAHFARETLRAQGAEQLLSQRWLSRRVLRWVLEQPWPGNTRQLKSWTTQAVLEAMDKPVLLPPPEPERAPPSSQDLEAVLHRHDYRLGAVAEAMGIGRNTLHRRMMALGIPRAGDLEEPVIRPVLDRSSSVDQAARELRVSVHGLKLRAKQLGLALPD